MDKKIDFTYPEGLKKATVCLEDVPEDQKEVTLMTFLIGMLLH